MSTSPPGTPRRSAGWSRPTPAATRSSATGTSATRSLGVEAVLGDGRRLRPRRSPQGQHWLPPARAAAAGARARSASSLRRRPRLVPLLDCARRGPPRRRVGGGRRWRRQRRSGGPCARWRRPSSSWREGSKWFGGSSGWRLRLPSATRRTCSSRRPRDADQAPELIEGVESLQEVEAVTVALDERPAVGSVALPGGPHRGDQRRRRPAQARRDDPARPARRLRRRRAGGRRRGRRLRRDVVFGHPPTATCTSTCSG